MPPQLHLNPSDLDLGRVVADIEAIRRVNPQRFEMEQLSAIVYVDPEQQVIAGFKDVYEVPAVEKALQELSPSANEAQVRLGELTAAQ